MADERLLAPIRRFWTPSEVETAYQKIFAAYGARLDKVTVIVQKSTGDDSAGGQVVVTGDDYLRWMEALETRLKELDAIESGVTGELENTGHANFGGRCVSL